MKTWNLWHIILHNGKPWISYSKTNVILIKVFFTSKHMNTISSTTTRTYSRGNPSASDSTIFIVTTFLPRNLSPFYAFWICASIPLSSAYSASLNKSSLLIFNTHIQIISETQKTRNLGHFAPETPEILLYNLSTVNKSFFVSLTFFIFCHHKKSVPFNTTIQSFNQKMLDK